MLFKNKFQGQCHGHITWHPAILKVKLKKKYKLSAQIDLVHRCVHMNQCIQSKLFLQGNSHRKNWINKFM